MGITAIFPRTNLGDRHYQTLLKTIDYLLDGCQEDEINISVLETTGRTDYTVIRKSKHE